MYGLWHFQKIGKQKRAPNHPLGQSQCWEREVWSILCSEHPLLMPKALSQTFQPREDSREYAVSVCLPLITYDFRNFSGKRLPDCKRSRAPAPAACRAQSQSYKQGRNFLLPTSSPDLAPLICTSSARCPSLQSGFYPRRPSPGPAPKWPAPLSTPLGTHPVPWGCWWGRDAAGALTPCMHTRPPLHIDPNLLGTPPARPRALTPGHGDAAMAFWAEGAEPALTKSARADAGPPAQHGGHNPGAYIHVCPLDTVAAGGGAGSTGSGLPAPQPCLLRRKTPSNCPAPTAPF